MIPATALCARLVGACPDFKSGSSIKQRFDATVQRIPPGLSQPPLFSSMPGNPSGTGRTSQTGYSAVEFLCLRLA